MAADSIYRVFEGWLELESDPGFSLKNILHYFINIIYVLTYVIAPSSGIFTLLLEDLGLDGVQVEEVFLYFKCSVLSVILFIFFF